MMPYSRVPLQEKSSNLAASRYKLATPPQVFANKNVFEPPMTNLDPAISGAHPVAGGVAHHPVPPVHPSLLSPAFSSPNQHFTGHAIQSHNPYPPPKMPLFIDPSSTKPKEKKRRKTKKELKEEAFDLSSEDKPPYSYATLIGISILSHDDKKLTLSQIYSWISDTFKYYKKEDVGWQNSIRHNLSLNKAFVKGEKSKDGKGHFWCIKPGCEDQFLKSKGLKASDVMDQIKNRPPPVTLPSSPPSEKEIAVEAPCGEERDTKRPKLDTPFVDWNEPPQITATMSPNSLSYSSSFSYSSNLELSPTRPNDPGPLLEPLTPCLLGKLKQGPMLKTVTSSATPKTQKTPKAIKTPMRTLKTPQSIMRKLWNSPSYIEEFFSPLVHAAHGGNPTIFNSYDDDDMVLRPLHQSPAFRKRRHQQSPCVTSSRDLMVDIKRAQDEEDK